MLAQAEMLVAFVLNEKISLGVWRDSSDGEEMDVKGQSILKSATVTNHIKYMWVKRVNPSS